MKTKLPAFTLIELLVSMILSAIVISFGYGSYSLINRQFQSYRSMKEQLKMTAQLNSVLSADFHKAALIRFEKSKLTLTLDTEQINYQFKPDLIIRSTEQNNDTFRSAQIVAEAQHLFPGVSPVISAFSYSCQLLEEKARFDFNKSYSAKTMIELEQQIQAWQ